MEWNYFKLIEKFKSQTMNESIKCIARRVDHDGMSVGNLHTNELILDALIHETEKLIDVVCIQCWFQLHHLGWFRYMHRKLLLNIFGLSPRWHSDLKWMLFEIILPWIRQ